MHIRQVTTRRGAKTYRYAQLVESYRRPDGMPAHRVLASLGPLPDLEVGNLKRALAASRAGREVADVVEAAAARRAQSVAVRANLGYLDIAVVLQTWNDLGIPALLRGAGGRRGAEVPDADVLAALAVHRCIAPDSKLGAKRWYPTTALPLLQGIDPAAFNNTRVHRALTALARAEERVQEALPPHLQSRDGAGFVALFLDTTDTWFEGRGPPLAQKGRDKEGIYRRRVGLALLCDPRGFPIRWKTLPGSYRDPAVMEEMCTELGKTEWVGTAPVVTDRAMGRAGSVESLVESGLRFLTAIAADEFVSYTHRLPEVPEAAGADADGLRAWAGKVGFTAVRAEDRYVLDLGRVSKGEGDATKGRRHRTVVPPMTVAAMTWARENGAAIAAGETRAAVATRRGTAEKVVVRSLALLALRTELQERVLAGDLAAATAAALHALARLPVDAQTDAFERLRASLAGKRPRRAHPGHLPPEPPPIEIRLVAHFNPERFLEQRRAMRAKLDEVEALVTTINDSLAGGNSMRRATTVAREIERQLARRKLLDVGTVEVKAGPKGAALRAAVRIDKAALLERHRYDGMNLLVAHPDLDRSAADLVDLYFAKDAVERDFHAIKSEIELRPVRHRTDPKVRAHVMLCVLALLVERTMEHKMRESGLHLSAPTALEELGTCHLNELTVGKTRLHQLTELTNRQREILGALGMATLADPRTDWGAPPT